MTVTGLGQDSELFKQAVDWVVEAGIIIKTRMGEPFDIKNKSGKTDLVTEVDREVEEYLVNRIQRNHPDHNVLGEEAVGNRNETESDSLWIIDPIDGTTNFIHRRKDFAISVAYCHEGKGVFGIVYDVMEGKLYSAMKGCGAYVNGVKIEKTANGRSLDEEILAINPPWHDVEEMRRWPELFALATKVRGVRVYGATTIELCEVAVGRLGGLVQFHINAWDYAACRVILEELGCKFTDLYGNDIGVTYRGALIAAEARLHEQIVRQLYNPKRSYDEIYGDFLETNGRTMTIAHRGDWKRAPENSLQAIRLSIVSGIDMVEIDVRKTKDNHLILMHDKTVDRMTDGYGNIADLTLQEIQRLRLREGQGGGQALLTNEEVATLKDAMMLVKNKVMVNLDKCWENREEVYQVLAETGTVGQALFKSTAEPDEVESFLEGKPDRPEYMQIIDETNIHLLERLDEIIERIRPRAFELLFRQDDSDIISYRTLRQLKGKSRIWVNTMWDSLCGGHTDEASLANHTTHGWNWLLCRGVNMIQTDSAEQLLDYVRRSSLDTDSRPD
ncbi:hypothetical protein MO973_11005 [Paenibacillus sp. TRM 82003]|nr:hypothetical protein [Paenibacillus sp. TRM 82003]